MTEPVVLIFADPDTTVEPVGKVVACAKGTCAIMITPVQSAVFSSNDRRACEFGIMASFSPT
jgi:hypothetical protein